MPRAYILIGAPASGKTTWTRANAVAATVVSSDDLIERFAEENDLTYTEAFARVDFKDIEREMWTRFHDAVQNGDDIVIDRTNMTAKSRRRFLDKLPDSYETVGVAFVPDFQTILWRLEKREAETGKHIPLNVVADMLKRYEPPTDAEFDRVEIIR